MATCNASSLLTANPFTQLDPGLQDAVKLQLLCDISAAGGGGTIGGSGTANTVPIFSAATTLANSTLTQSGTDITQAGRLRFSGTTHGGLVLNNLTTTQRDAIAAPLAGSLIWNSTTTRANVYTGSAWTSGWVRLEGDSMTGALNIAQGTITADAPALNITTIWNNNAVAFSAFRIDATSTASSTSSLLIDARVGGSPVFAVTRSGSTTIGAQLNFGSNLQLHCPAAYRFEQRFGTGANAFAVYNTYTSATNFERGVFDWITTANVLRIGTEKGSGGGTARDAVLVTDSSERVRLDINGNVVINTAAIATNATNGFLYVPSCAGTPTGVPTAYTGRVPIVVDTTANKLYFYSTGAWRDAGP